MTDFKTPISVFIIAKDEVDRIGDVIKSVQGFAAEVIVVDSGSTDGTVALSRDLGANVVHHDFEGYGQQKRYAESLCVSNWLLNLDADEPLTDAAAAEIAELSQFGRLAENDCWRLPIATIYPHEKRPAPWAYSYNQLRLYDRTKAGFSASSVHDSVIPQEGARIGMLKHAAAHHSHRNINFQVEKMNRYAEMQVADMIVRGRTLPKWRLLTEFPFAFLKAYFIRRHFLYGFWGFSLAMSYAFSRHLRVAKYHEAQLQAAAKASNP